MTRSVLCKQAFTLLESLVMLAAVSIFTLLLAGMLKAQWMPTEATPVEGLPAPTPAESAASPKSTD